MFTKSLNRTLSMVATIGFVVLMVTHAPAALITTPVTDNMDNGNGFFTVTNTDVIANGTTVTIERSAAGDAFVRYNSTGNAADFFAIDVATGRVEIDFTDFNLGGLQIRIDFGGGSPSTWQVVNFYDTVGTFVIHNVPQVALDAGRADATQYRLFFRQTGGATPPNASGATIDEIRILAVPEPASVMLLAAGSVMVLMRRRSVKQ